MLLYDSITNCSIIWTLGLLSLGCAADGDSGGEPAGDTSDGTTGAIESTESGTAPDDDVDGADSSSGDPASTCGNGWVEPAEACDGLDVGGLSCRDIDPTFAGGVLACGTDCTFDTSACTTLPNPIQQCQLSGNPIRDLATLTDTIVLPSELSDRVIVDVDVDVELDHSYLGDLHIEVIHGDTAVTLHDSCGTEEDLHVTYDDEADDDFRCQQSDDGLTVLPVGTLADFEGIAPSPDWTLSIRDEATFDSGTLERWCVSIQWR